MGRCGTDCRIDEGLSHLHDNYDDFQSISDIVLEPDIPYGQEYISLLVRQGKIAGMKEGRNWKTTKNAVLQYMETRDRQR